MGKDSKKVPRKTSRPGAAVRTIAVIDIGSSSIRMAIAEVRESGELRTLDTLSQSVRLGEDTFRQGSIRRATIEEAVGVLKSYKKVLEEYGLTDPAQVRAIATSAVREASNREAFLDRVYIATGIQVMAIDEAEVNRLTYLGVRPFLAKGGPLAEGTTLVAEVGGGTTELLLVRGRDVLFSQSYRLGALRLQEVLEAYRTPTRSKVSIMKKQIARTIGEIRFDLPVERCDHMVALGGDVRLAATELASGEKARQLGKVTVAALSRFTDKLLAMTPDEIVRVYRTTYADADTAAPALLAYVQLARAMGVRHILPSSVTLRDGLLQEMGASGAWTEEFREQIIRAALNLGRKYKFNEKHARHVADLSGSLFRALQEEHQLGDRYELILYIAALLHEIGLFLSIRSHHKHSMYLIMNSELFGLGQQDLLLVALVARYHRRAAPKPAHLGYASLDHEGRIAVAKMAAILRVADALERSHSQRVKNIRCAREDNRLVITVPRIADLSLEQLALKQKGRMFEDVYGTQVLLRKRQARES